MEAADAKLRTYGNWRRPMSAGIGRFGMIGTGLLLLSVIVGIFVMAVFGLIVALIVAAIFASMLSTLVIRDPYGRTLLQRMSAWVFWRRAVTSGAHLYRSGPLGRNPWGTFQLPGLVARTTLSEAVDSYQRPFALLHTPRTAHFTVVFGCSPDGGDLVDQEQIDIWVAHWGHWLASLADEPGVVSASVTVETAPDTGTRLRRHVFSSIDPGAPAKDMLHQVVDAYPAGSATVRAWVALTFAAVSRAGGKNRNRNSDEVARDLAARLPGLTQRLNGTGAGVALPMTAQQLCEVVRVAYEPQVERWIEEAYAANDVPELDWGNVGPSAAESRWGSYRHDGATSVTWSMTAAPRGEVQSSVLQQLLAPHRDIARKRVTMLYRPMDSATAAQVVESDKKNADFRVNSADRPSARAQSEKLAADHTARDEARGNGLVNFGMLVTATTLDEELLRDMEAAIDNLAATARVQLRPVYGSQDSAFAACLPLGLVLPNHLNVPAKLRSAL